VLSERESGVASFGAADVELRRIRPSPLIEIRRAQNAGDQVAFWDPLSRELDILRRLARNRTDGRVEA